MAIVYGIICVKDWLLLRCSVEEVYRDVRAETDRTELRWFRALLRHRHELAIQPQPPAELLSLKSELTLPGVHGIDTPILPISCYFCNRSHESIHSSRDRHIKDRINNGC